MLKKKINNVDIVAEAKKAIDKAYADWKKRKPAPKEWFRECKGDPNKAVKLYALTSGTPTMSNPLSLMMAGVLDEGLIKTYPIEKTMDYIKKHFQLEDFQLGTFEDDPNRFFLMIPNIGDNIKLVLRALDYCGWYPGVINLAQGFPFMFMNDQWVRIQCERKFTDKLKKDKLPKVLYHYTPRYNLKKIMKIGLVPGSKNKLFNYPERIYFMGGIDKNEMDGWAKPIYWTNSQVNPRNEGIYAVLKVNTEKLPENIHFETDPNMPKCGFYTTDNIPPKFIKLDRYVNFEEENED